jgi:hypothetical protein
VSLAETWLKRADGQVASPDEKRNPFSYLKTGAEIIRPALNGRRDCQLHGAGDGAPQRVRASGYVHAGRSKDVVQSRHLVTNLARVSGEIG